MTDEANRLFAAVEANDLDTIYRMKAEDASFEYTHKENYHSLLTYAVYHGHCEMVKTLVSLGMDVNGEDGMGNTPLVWAVSRKNSVEITRVLLDLGADINQQSAKFGMTALRAAAMNNNAEMTRFLIEKGANQTLKSCDGRSAEDMTSSDRCAHANAVFEICRREKREGRLRLIRRHAQKRGTSGLRPS